MPNHTVLTQEGYEKLVNELNRLTNIKRQRAVDRLKKAREMGDLSENSEYAAAKEALSFIDSRIFTIEEVLKQAKVANHHTGHQVVEVGSVVEVESQGVKEVFTIVGELEADIAKKKLSISSPLGKNLTGKKTGEKVVVQTPGGTVSYTILAIRS